MEQFIGMCSGLVPVCMHIRCVFLCIDVFTLHQLMHFVVITDKVHTQANLTSGNLIDGASNQFMCTIQGPIVVTY